jgi:hypothetical protein
MDDVNNLLAKNKVFFGGCQLNFRLMLAHETAAALPGFQ